jgi:hypothetical protein
LQLVEREHALTALVFSGTAATRLLHSTGH